MQLQGLWRDDSVAVRVCIAGDGDGSAVGEARGDVRSAEGEIDELRVEAHLEVGGGLPMWTRLWPSVEVPCGLVETARCDGECVGEHPRGMET